MSIEKNISLVDFPKVALLCGPNNCNIKFMRDVFHVKINVRDTLKIIGEKEDVEKASQVITTIKKRLLANNLVTPRDVEKISAILLRKNFNGDSQTPNGNHNHKTNGKINGKANGQSHQPEEGFIVNPRTPGQRAYMEMILKKDLVFGIGPAGTGKTYLAVAMAIAALKQDLVRKIVLVRPAVEAGERLGFLPGDFQAKINPYLRPLYDALHSLVENEKLKKYTEKGLIEVAPLAYMRGRTLENSFIILDEAQNTTVAQMKMFLTRLGLSSKIVVTGDTSQVDLPFGKLSGLTHVERVLRGIGEIGFSYLGKEDIVRHRLVQLIVGAYEKEEQKKERRRDREKDGNETSNH